MDGPAFATDVDRVLVPELQAGDLVVWDNLSSHKNVVAVAAIEAIGAKVEPLPVNRSDLTPMRNNPIFFVCHHRRQWYHLLHFQSPHFWFFGSGPACTRFAVCVE